jgi:hypothetical protein
MTEETTCTATRLHYEDELLRTLDLPRARLSVVRGIGSGLARRPGDPPGTFWAAGDRGPNLKIGVAVERFGLGHLATHRARKGTKVMPCPEIGPAMSELRIHGDTVVLVRTLPLRNSAGRPLSGLPTPGTEAAIIEPAVTIDGASIPADAAGADTEGIAAAADGSFWIGDEYGPSLLHVSPDGTVLERRVPRGLEHFFADAGYPVRGTLPAIAALRQLNRGFEGLALSADSAALYLAFQSPLAHPNEDAHRRARHVRILQMDIASGEVTAQFLYPLDLPESFRRDLAQGDFERSDLKISELVMLRENRLLVLERGSATTKLYAVTLDADRAVPRAHLDPATRPTLEELSALDRVRPGIPVLEKTPIFTTDDFPEMDADLEGLILLSSRTLLLVNDNDFGVEDVATRFWRIDLPFNVTEA